MSKQDITHHVTTATDGATPTHTAEVGISAAIALGEMCAVTVVDDSDIRKGMEAKDTALRIDGDHTREEIIDAAEDVLHASGWKVTGEWEDGDNSYYVTVTPA